MTCFVVFIVVVKVGAGLVVVEARLVVVSVAGLVQLPFYGQLVVVFTLVVLSDVTGLVVTGLVDLL